MNVYTDEYEWYVANALEDAKEMQRNHWGYDFEIQGDMEWTECNPNDEMMIWLDDEGNISEWEGNLVVGTFRDWAEAFGPGFLCTTER